MPKTRLNHRLDLEVVERILQLQREQKSPFPTFWPTPWMP